MSQIRFTYIIMALNLHYFHCLKLELYYTLLLYCSLLGFFKNKNVVISWFSSVQCPS